MLALRALLATLVNWCMPIPLGCLQSLSPQATIVHLEMVNVIIALNIFKSYSASRSVIIHCGNMAVVRTFNSGRAWDEFLGTVARNIWLFTSLFDITLTVATYLALEWAFLHAL